MPFGLGEVSARRGAGDRSTSGCRCSVGRRRRPGWRRERTVHRGAAVAKAGEWFRPAWTPPRERPVVPFQRRAPPSKDAVTNVWPSTSNEMVSTNWRWGPSAPRSTAGCPGRTGPPAPPDPPTASRVPRATTQPRSPRRRDSLVAGRCPRARSTTAYVLSSKVATATRPPAAVVMAVAGWSSWTRGPAGWSVRHRPVAHHRFCRRSRRRNRPGLPPGRDGARRDA